MGQIYQDDAQIASGQKLNKPSDDPVAMSSIINGKAQLQSFEGYQNAISSATVLLNATNTALAASDRFFRRKNRPVQLPLTHCRRIWLNTRQF